MFSFVFIFYDSNARKTYVNSWKQRLLSEMSFHFEATTYSKLVQTIVGTHKQALDCYSFVIPIFTRTFRRKAIVLKRFTLLINFEPF